MTTIHIIESAEERTLVKRIFRERMTTIADGEMLDVAYNSFHGGINYDDDWEESYIPGNGAIVYDIKDVGDPELGWMVYDFRGNGQCYAVEEHGLAGLVDELPSDVFPF